MYGGPILRLVYSQTRGRYGQAQRQEMDRFREKEKEEEMTENIIAILDNGINHFGRYVKIYDPSKE